MNPIHKPRTHLEHPQDTPLECKLPQRSHAGSNAGRQRHDHWPKCPRSGVPWGRPDGGSQGRVKGRLLNPLLPLPAHGLAAPTLTLVLILTPVFLAAHGSRGPPRGGHSAEPVSPCPHRRWHGQKSEGIQPGSVRRLGLAGPESPWMKGMAQRGKRDKSCPRESL